MCDKPYPFNQAKHYHAGRQRPIRVIVVHDMEVAESATTAEAVARMFHKGDRLASAHFCVDKDSLVQCVKVGDTAFHAPGANADGIGIEHAGFARQSRSQWLADDMMLNISAAVAAELVNKFWIPPVRLSVAQLRDGKSRGFAGHVDVTNAFHKSTHTDPGSSFPWDVYLDKIKWMLPHAKAQHFV